MSTTGLVNVIGVPGAGEPLGNGAIWMSLQGKQTATLELERFHELKATDYRPADLCYCVTDLSDLERYLSNSERCQQRCACLARDAL